MKNVAIFLVAGFAVACGGEFDGDVGAAESITQAAKGGGGGGGDKPCRNNCDPDPLPEPTCEEYQADCLARFCGDENIWLPGEQEACIEGCNDQYDTCVAG